MWRRPVESPATGLPRDAAAFTIAATCKRRGVIMLHVAGRIRLLLMAICATGLFGCAPRGHERLARNETRPVGGRVARALQKRAPKLHLEWFRVLPRLRPLRLRGAWRRGEVVEGQGVWTLPLEGVWVKGQLKGMVH